MQKRKREEEGLPPSAKRVNRDPGQDPKVDFIVPAWEWSNDEVGYFYPDYNADKEHFGVKQGDSTHITLFFNPHAFVNHIRALVVFRSVTTMRSNIHLCLRDDALDWYNIKLSDAERRSLRDHPLEHANGWFNQIIKRFGISHAKGISNITSAVSGKSISATARNILRYCQAVGILEPHMQLMQIWEYLVTRHLDITTYLDRPREETTLSEFMRELYVAEHDKYPPAKRHDGNKKSPVEYKGSKECNCYSCSGLRY